MFRNQGKKININKKFLEKSRLERIHVQIDFFFNFSVSLLDLDENRHVSISIHKRPEINNAVNFLCLEQNNIFFLNLNVLMNQTFYLNQKCAPRPVD